MSAKLYDDAIVEKLQNLLNPQLNIHVLKPDETSRLFNMKADESKDKLTLPIIALSRRGYKIQNANKQPKSYDGIKIRAYDKDDNLINNGSVLKLNAIPILLEYQLDIITLDLEQCEEYSREFVFAFVNNPTGCIELPYNDAKVHHKFTMHLEEDVEDNSDIQERLFSSQFTRYTLRIMVDDAYLFSIPNRKNVVIAQDEMIVEDRQSHKEIDRTLTINIEKS